MHWSQPANSAKDLSSSQSAYCTNSFISGLEKLEYDVITLDAASWCIELVSGSITKWFKSATIWLFEKGTGFFSLISWILDTGVFGKLIFKPCTLSDPPLHVLEFASITGSLFLLLSFIWSLVAAKNFLGGVFLFKIRQSVQTSWKIHYKYV